MKMRKGFTLVELLIVIVIIGILAAAMLLSSGSATASAEASNITSDLRSMKAAALMLFADSMDAYNLGSLGNGSIAYLRRYMDNPAKFANTYYQFYIETGASGDNKWWVGFDLSAANKTREVRQKLGARALSIGIYKDTSSYDDSNAFTETDTEAWMVAR